jgi:NAD(P)-dependent dehydrogenase (short-subunit alcohol dehydrogenase family)
MADGSVVIIGGTSGIGRELAQFYADAGEEVVLSGRESDRAEGVAGEIGGKTRGIALDLTEPHDLEAALKDIGAVRYLMLVGIDRDANVITDYDVDAARRLVTMKLVGYTEVVHQLHTRLTDDASIVVFGGLAKDRPYPGSTTVTTINGGVSSMVRTLALQLAPIRVNAIHPAIVGDSPFWADKPAEVLEGFRSRTPLGRLITMSDVVHATDFLLTNPAVTGINLRVDGGWMLT